MESVTADANYVYAGGNTNDNFFVPQNGDYAVILKVDIATTNWVWRRLYTESTTNNLSVITALALNPASTKLAVFATKAPAETGHVDSFLFAVDTDSGFLASKMATITSESRYSVGDHGIIFESSGKVYVAFNNIEPNNNRPANYEQKLRVGSFDTVTGSM